ncbi:serine/arginine repetitive matrix protein 2-like [Belonocnema kinseyi]|uniref:serine/arginine repetitive matrix protein 2-like n=1 Tax=Belonocnema kinseyi TaxID=2817044 RepID=UPI00143D7EC1|nr:serine/arginine repetitive matrix protein 2-like [Belonocnema kinseyi]
MSHRSRRVERDMGCSGSGDESRRRRRTRSSSKRSRREPHYSSRRQSRYVEDYGRDQSRSPVDAGEDQRHRKSRSRVRGSRTTGSPSRSPERRRQVAPQLGGIFSSSRQTIHRGTKFRSTDGIHDEQLRTSLVTAKKRTLTELSQCLGSLADEKSKESKNSRDGIDNKRSADQGKSKKPFKRFDRNACFKCGKKGHRKDRCPELNSDERSKAGAASLKDGASENDKSATHKDDRDRIRCTYCNKPGHLEKDCYTKKNRDRKERNS